MMSGDLLQHTYYGYEVDEAEKNLIGLSKLLQYIGLETAEEVQRKAIHLTNEFFSHEYHGVFDGPITYGDALYIAYHMSIVRPNFMIEVGVASGFSSAFILYAARELDLFGSDKFLYSFDIDDGRLSNKPVGQFVYLHYEDLSKFWSPFLGATTLEIEKHIDVDRIFHGKKGLVFIDGGHNHPWPTVDLIQFSKFLQKGTICLMQDVRMMDRWLMDCIKYNSVCPKPIRGVDIAYGHWPTKKYVGVNLFYNMCTLKLDASDQELEEYADLMSNYEFEIDFEESTLLSLVNNGPSANGVNY